MENYKLVSLDKKEKDLTGFGLENRVKFIENKTIKYKNKLYKVVYVGKNKEIVKKDLEWEFIK